ncbi:hypothetical protein [Pseudonocardia parietis]|uniref:Uncharacterized protein n=1 Tax=Pseudonocardia parietis TaxID=570936 RepID=A0ABS4VXB6_9PSEU|nr:hypothetical protein [Pseudonocardia parietis]MBP2368441.1 hypothetical protein [Pseudonocardia parietis]
MTRPRRWARRWNGARRRCRDPLRAARQLLHLLALIGFGAIVVATIVGASLLYTLRSMVG